MVAFRSASSDFEQPRSLQHLVDDAEQHADVKVKRALSPPPPRRRPRARRPTRSQPQWVSRSHAAASTKCIIMRLASFLLITGVLCAHGFIHSALAPAHGAFPRPAAVACVSPPLQPARYSIASQSAPGPSQTFAFALVLPQSVLVARMLCAGVGVPVSRRCKTVQLLAVPRVCASKSDFAAESSTKRARRRRWSRWVHYDAARCKAAVWRMHKRSRCGFLHGLHGGKKQNFL